MTEFCPRKSRPTLQKFGIGQDGFFSFHNKKKKKKKKKVLSALHAVTAVAVCSLCQKNTCTLCHFFV